MQTKKALATAGLIVGMGMASVAQASLISGFGAPSSNAALTGGTAIDFTSATVGTYTSLALGGVTFSSGSNATFVITDVLGDDYNTTGRNLQNQQVPGSTSVLNFLFSGTVNAFGFNFGASNENWRLEALDGANNVIESHILTQTWSSNSGDYFGIFANGIASARLTQLTHVYDAGVDWVLMDNFTFSGSRIGGQIPEPGSLMLLGAGFAALGWRRRRNRR